MIIYTLRSATFIGFLVWTMIAPARANDFSEYSLADQRFSQLVANAALNHDMPRLSDSTAANILSVLSDHRRFLEARPFTSLEMGDVIDMCGAANRASMSYLLFGLEKYVDKSMTDPVEVARIILQLGTRNSVTYQDEMTPLLAFHYRCLAKELPLLTAFVATLKPTEFTDVRRDGLAQVRRGIFTIYFAIAGTATDPGISPRNRREMFAAMTEVSPLYSQALDLTSRQQVHDYFNSLAASIPDEFASQYRQITKDLSAVNCEGFCRL